MCYSEIGWCVMDSVVPIDGCLDTVFLFVLNWHEIHWRQSWVWWRIFVRPLVVCLNPGPIMIHHGLRSRQSHNGQMGQPNGLSGVRHQPDHSSSSQSNSRHSIQHEGHQRCLVFGKLAEPHHNQTHPNHFHHQRYQHQSYYSPDPSDNSAGAIRWITARKNFNSAWLTTLSAPPSLEIYNSLTHCQNYRHANRNGYNKENSLWADTKI